MTRHITRGGNIWIRMFPDIPITKKTREVRQEQGKGNVDNWLAQVQRVSILYEMSGVE